MPQTENPKDDRDRGKLTINGVDIPIDLRIQPGDEEKIDQAATVLGFMFGKDRQRLMAMLVAGWCLGRVELEQAQPAAADQPERQSMGASPA